MNNKLKINFDNNNIKISYKKYFYETTYDKFEYLINYNPKKKYLDYIKNNCFNSYKFDKNNIFIYWNILIKNFEKEIFIQISLDEFILDFDLCTETELNKIQNILLEHKIKFSRYYKFNKYFNYLHILGIISIGIQNCREINQIKKEFKKPSDMDISKYNKIINEYHKEKNKNEIWKKYIYELFTLKNNLI